MTKSIVLLGSTGSIGRQTLEVARELGLRVEALSANTSLDLLEQQTREFLPHFVVLYDEAAAREMKERIADLDIQVLSGMEGLLEIASLDTADTVVTAVVGMIGLQPTMAAIKKGKRIAFANKETLVCAGEMVMDAAEKYGAEIIPVDSEHSAIFQCLQGMADKKELKRLILTCSGGPFFGVTREQLCHVTKADALKHPNWKMGEKITIDCATLMNKGLEVIEAMRLYDMSDDKVDVVIHRQSIVHSMVELTDGAVMAQLGAPDMRLPIQLALTYPHRQGCPVDRLDFTKCGTLTFSQPDTQAFPCLALAYRCAKLGGNACAVMNGANEAAVALFLNNEIGFYDIYELVNGAVESVPFIEKPTLEQILESDRLARAYVAQRQAN